MTFASELRSLGVPPGAVLLVHTALARVGAGETVFLHPAGACTECDLARSRGVPQRGARHQPG